MTNSERITVSAAGDTLRDFYPLPGTRIKQWVVEARRELTWELETCPRVTIDPHDDNTGVPCRNHGYVPWTHLDHDCCDVCCALHDSKKVGADVVSWLSERAQRPAITADREALSDQIEPRRPMPVHPLVARMRVRK